ncbi:uncharacterized protein LOC135136565 isoform X2 [Zophobas morio]|uniref:uncharacterized protein LOC135136565 isoform X2 n=1 Tax=Zophobas morio TaxID=2755281 RepID=UPI0030834D97
MGLPWRGWLIFAWWTAGIYGYNVQRLDDPRQSLNLGDFFFSPETNKFLDDRDESTSEEALYPNTRNPGTTRPPGAGAQKQMFLLFVHNDNYTGGSPDSTPLDSWSVVWYIASFGGLIVFFLIVSCSEWCCRRAIRNSQQNCSRNAPTTASPSVPDTPPPSYDQFAPPSYESICLGRNRSGEKSEYDIYVVPVHTLGSLVESRREDEPPSYLSASGGALPGLEDNRAARVT